jgi:intracellular multiplication protein IcmD
MEMKKVGIALLTLACFGVAAVALAQQGQTSDAAMGVGGVAAKVTSNVANIARLITAASYVAGMAFAVGAIVKFKAHKDNPTQIPIGTPIALLFVGAALIFIPTVFRVSGQTMFGASGQVSTVSGLTSFQNR